MSAVLIGNLDFENALARGLRPTRPPAELPAAVKAMTSAAATLMRALGRDGDRLWTPVPVEAARLASGLPAVELVSGPLPGDAAGILAWGETDAVTRVRRDALHRDASWWEELFWVHPTPAVAARCNDRRFAARLGRELGLGFGEARVVHAVDELERCLPALAAAGHEATWVAKAPLSASGRERVRRSGDRLDDLGRTRVERLLHHYEVLLVEPWVARIADVGCCGLVEGANQWRVLPVHGLEVDAAGVFRGIVLGDVVELGLLEAAEARVMTETADAVARRLADSGYRGAFGIDGYAWRDGEGRRQFHPLSEVNARLSFGLVARVIAERLAPRAERVALRFGSGAPPAGVQPVLLPGAAEKSSAWLDVRG